MVFGLTRPERERTTFTITTKPSRRGLTRETGITHFRFITALTFLFVFLLAARSISWGNSDTIFEMCKSV